MAYHMVDEKIYTLTIIHFEPKFNGFTEDEQIYEGTFEQLKEYFYDYINNGFIKSAKKSNKSVNPEPKNMKELCNSIKRSSYNLNDYGLMDITKYSRKTK